MGYLKDPKQTAEAIDKQGYLHSGDEGYLDEDGFLHLTGRMKELIITTAGENISPTIIENGIKDK